MMWKDRLFGTKRLHEAFPRLFRLEEDEKAKASERGMWDLGEWKWSWRWRREPRGREIGEFEELTSSLAQEKEDKMEWLLDDSKEYTIKKIRDILERHEGNSGIA